MTHDTADAVSGDAGREAQVIGDGPGRPGQPNARDRAWGGPLRPGTGSGRRCPRCHASRGRGPPPTRAVAQTRPVSHAGSGGRSRAA